MADEKKKAVNTSEAKKSDKKDKKPSKFSPKNIGKGIKRFFKDLKGETKKIVWPGRQMVIKSTGIVLAAILVIGAGIWLIDFALAGAVGAVDKAAQNATTTEAVSETENASGDEKVETSDPTEPTTAA